MVAYLRDDARERVHQLYPNGYVARFGSMPPTVRVAQGATPAMVDETVRAVQLINAALPRDWQLRFTDTPGPAGIFRGDDGEILVEFAAHRDWAAPDKPPPDEAVGLARWWSESRSTGDPAQPWVFEIVTGRVWVDHTRVAGGQRMETLVHEIVHTLGRGHPTPARFPDSIMNIPSSGPEGHVLHPLDREALLAVYGRLDPGSTPDSLFEDLGPWMASSVHVKGELTADRARLDFGVAHRNGLGQPWVSGPAPHRNLEDNRSLSGSATWTGRLLGFAPDAAVVSGAAALLIQLATLDGDLGFTELETWASGQAPGATGTGAMWGDGDLSYQVSVRGNTFARTGGDDGTVNGAFFGPNHELAGGVVHRDDLSAAFGAER